MYRIFTAISCGQVKDHLSAGSKPIEAIKCMCQLDPLGTGIEQHLTEIA